MSRAKEGRVPGMDAAGITPARDLNEITSIAAGRHPHPALRRPHPEDVRRTGSWRSTPA